MNGRFAGEGIVHAQGLKGTTMESIGPAAAAAAMDAVFTNYLVPVSWSPDVFERHVLANDGRLDVSPVWFDDDGAVVAATLLALRGTRVWIGGFGVAPAYRGRGLGRAIVVESIARARGLGAGEITLEVLTKNAAAIAVYERYGFRIQRKLQTLVGQPLAEIETLPDFDVDAAIAAAPADLPCWQHARESQRHWRPYLLAVGSRDEFILYVRNTPKGRANTFKTNARDAEGLERLASAIRTAEGFDSISLFNEPEDGYAARAARELGWRVESEQYEMHLAL